MISERTHGVVALFGDHDGDRAAGLDLTNVRQQLGVQCGRAFGRGHDDDDRQLVFDQRDRTMLELTGGEALGVHVRQFFELERALQGHRVADVAPQEQHGRGLREPVSQVGHRLDRRNDPGHQIGHRFQLAVLPLDLVGIFGAARLGQRQAQQIVGGHLGQEGLGGGHPDLRAGAGVEHRVAFARDLRAVGVADRQHLGLLLLGVADGLEGVRGFTGLRDGHHQGAAVQHRVAVAELAGELHLHRKAGPMLDRVLGEQTRVIGGAAGDHEDLVDLPQLLVR